jgi:hypothetical protein
MWRGDWFGGPNRFGTPVLAKIKGSATKFEGVSVTEAQVRIGFATGQAEAAGESTRGEVLSIGVRFSGEGPQNIPMLHEPFKKHRKRVGELLVLN